MRPSQPAGKLPPDGAAPSVVLVMLEMLQIVLGRHDPKHHERHEHAKRLMADPRGRAALQRFAPHQRVQHWFLALTFITLALTGFPIKFADRPWAAALIEEIGSLSRARLLHRWAGMLLIAGFMYHVVYVMASTVIIKRRSGQGWIRTFLTLPMMMQWRDAKEIAHLLGYLLFLRRTRPTAGRFSLEEKFEYIGVFWGTIILGVTGVMMWANGWTSQMLGGRGLTTVSLIHTFEAFLALMHVGVVHLVGVIFVPAVLPCSPAMFTGNTPMEELAEGHAAMLDEVEKQLASNADGEVNRD